jgi:hypothetical protein
MEGWASRAGIEGAFGNFFYLSRPLFFNDRINAMLHEQLEFASGI